MGTNKLIPTAVAIYCQFRCLPSSIRIHPQRLTTVKNCIMPKTSTSRRSRFRSFSQIFTRSKHRRGKTISSTTADASSAGKYPSSTSTQADGSSSTQNKGSHANLTRKESRPAPNRWAQTSDIIFPNSSASFTCPVDHSSNNSTRHYDFWHDEDSPVGLSQDRAERHSMDDLGTTSPESRNSWRRSEIVLPRRNSPDTPFSPARKTFHFIPDPSQARFDKDSLADRRFSSYHPPGPVEAMSNLDDPSERSFHHTPRPARSAAFSHIDLPLRNFAAPIRSSPKETPVHDRSPAELDDEHINRPVFSGNFGSELILPSTAPTEQNSSICTQDSDMESSTFHELSDVDIPATTATKRAFSLQHGNFITDLPTNDDSSHSIDSLGISVPEEATLKVQDEHEGDVLAEHEDGIAYEDDEACCGKCDGFWWAEKDKYKAFWGERPCVEELVEGENEKWRCHRCEQIRSRKKAVVIVEAEMRGSVESFRTAIGMFSICHGYILEKLTVAEGDDNSAELETNTEEKRMSEERESKDDRRKTQVPGEWPES